jgi:hypothetical protein
MEHFHLFGEIFFQPFVLADNIVNELDGEVAVDFDSTLAFLLAVEPCLGPPYNAVLVGIDTDGALDVETLNVYVEIFERVDDTLTFYSPVKSFFLSFSLIVDRNTPCIRAR